MKKLQSIGLQVDYREWSITELNTAIENDKPVVIFVRTGFMDIWQEDFAHAIVIVGIEPEHQFWINDPAKKQALLPISWDGLLAAWAKFSYRGATVSNPK
ncbi:MAG: hypothetical protein GY796_26710 [Chloroflexi bacterium]|nr:hypothetical protein [Chloroflexota bacterium]